MKTGKVLYLFRFSLLLVDPANMGGETWNHHGELLLVVQVTGFVPCRAAVPAFLK